MRNNNFGTPDESVGPVRRGQGLLSGLLRCRRCGRKLHVRYWGRSGTNARYFCAGDYEVGGSYCLRFSGRGADRRFADELLAALQPFGIEASIEAIRQLENRNDARREALTRKLEQAEYEARRAFEQYDEVDPHRRLVAAELERRWEDKLQRAGAIKLDLAALARETKPLSADERAELKALGAQLHDVWHSPSYPPDMKKRIVRAVVDEILVDEPTAGKLHFIVHWKGGTHTSFEMNRPQPGLDERNAVEDIELIRRMAVRYGDDLIAGVLNRGDRRTGKGNRWTSQRVTSARKQNGITGRKETKPDPEILSLLGAARYCRVSNTTITRLIKAGILPCQQIAPFAPQEIRRADLDSAPVQRALEHLRTTGRVLPPGRPSGGVSTEQRSLFEVNPGKEKDQAS